MPLLGRIRDAWPDAHIAWAIEPKSTAILEQHPWLNETILYNRNKAPWSFVPFLKRVRDGRFDLTIDLQRHLKSGIISMISGATRSRRIQCGEHQRVQSSLLDAPHRISTRDAS